MEISPKRDPESTRNTILDTAERLFLERGFSAVAIAEIARTAKITKSLIHHHFGSKEGLWSAVKTRRFAEYHNRQLAMLRSYDGNESLLHDSMIAYFRFLETNPQMVRLASWIALEGKTPCPAQQDELYTLGIQRLEELQQQGTLRTDIPAAFILISFLSLIQGWFRANQTQELALMGLESGAEVNERYLEALLKLFFEGITPR